MRRRIKYPHAGCSCDAGQRERIRITLGGEPVADVRTARLDLPADRSEVSRAGFSPGRDTDQPQNVRCDE